MTRYKALILSLLLLAFAPSVLAQADCPSIVQAALETVESNCASTGRNQACYGNEQLVATPRQGVGDFAFEQPGDVVDIATIQSVQLSSMSLTDTTWGVALLKVQANLPDTLPGQNVTFLLFGDVQIENTVTDAPEISMTVAGNANVRLRPTTSENNVIGGLQRGQEITATGRLADNTWVRILLPDDESGVGWVSAQFIEGDLTALAVVEPDVPSFGPMQAFYFKSGIADRPCDQAPDSGILIQTPEGAGRVSLAVNGVNIQLSSTVYLQAGGGYMTVSVIEGLAVLDAFGTTQIVPADTAARVPLDVDGLASGAPEFPQPYDAQSLQSLPLNAAVLPEQVEVAPAPAADATQITPNPIVDGDYSVVWTPIDDCNGDYVLEFPPVWVTVYNTDGSVTTFGRTWFPAGGTTYTYADEFGETGVLTFTAPTSFTGWWGIVLRAEGPDPCPAKFGVTGVWASS
jgi:hypothetical protein